MLTCALAAIGAWIETGSSQLGLRLAATAIGTGLVFTAGAYFIQTWAQARTTATRAALIYSLEPVFAAVYSLAIAGIALSGHELAGAGLILAGVLVAELGPAWLARRNHRADELARGTGTHEPGSTGTSTFALVDPTLERWSRSNRIPLYTRHRDEEVRSFLLAGPTGKRTRIWVEIGDPITVKVWDFGDRTRALATDEAGLASTLDQALLCAETWVGGRQHA